MATNGAPESWDQEDEVRPTLALIYSAKPEPAGVHQDGPAQRGSPCLCAECERTSLHPLLAACS